MSQNFLTKTIEPLAQTFNVSEESGVFITKIGLYFSAVSSTLPVTVELRNAFMGTPTNETLPGSVVTKTSAQMSSAASSTAATETTFEFDEPIYLHGGKTYAFVIRTNATNEYKVWQSFLGDYKLGTTQERVTRNIEPGIMFKSQGGLRYGAEAQSDIKFKLYRAQFSASSGTAVFQDDNPPLKLLGSNPLTGAAGDATITVAHDNHGFQVADKVNIQGLTAGTNYNGILGSSIMGQRAVTGIDGTGFTFEADSTCDSAISFGGSTITSTQQYIMDVAQLQIQEFVPDVADLTYSGSFTTSKSFAGSETKGATTSGVELKNQRDHFFDNPHVILTDSNEAAYASIAQSTKITATLSGLAGNDFVSPVIDVQRAHLLTINNLIDRPDNSATTDFNVPLTFVAETDPTNSSALAAHITKPVRLANGASGLKVLFGGHRMSGSHLDLYYRTTLTGTDSDILENSFILASIDNAVPNDVSKETFHEYTYTIGGDFAKDEQEFDQYQLKLVMTGQNSSNVPRVKDLRTIAVA